MNAKLDKNTLLAYLYNELDEKARQEVELYLETYPSAKAELEELKNMRNLLGNLKDKKVNPPTFIFEKEKNQALNGKIRPISASKPIFNAGFIRTMTGIAATLTLFFLLSYFSQLDISYQENEFKISFGKKSDKPLITNKLDKENSSSNLSQNLSKEEVNQLILSYLQQNKDSLNQKLTLLENQWNYKLKNKNLMISKNENSLDNQTAKILLEQIRQENLKTMLQITELSAQQQQESVEKMFTNFVRYYERQRKEDLKFVEANLNNLQEHQENSIKKQVMTEQILARLITNK